MKTLGHALDLRLTFQVKGAGGRSNEAMGHLQDHVRPGAFGALGERRPLNAVALAQRDDFFTLNVHDRLLSLTARVCGN